MKLRWPNSTRGRSTVISHAAALIVVGVALFVFSSVSSSDAWGRAMANQQPTPGPDQEQTAVALTVSVGVSVTTAELMALERQIAGTGAPVQPLPVRKRPGNP